MAHYDWLYETFTLKETEEKINRTNQQINTFVRKKSELESDLTNISASYTKEVIQNKIVEIESIIKKYQKELNGWNVVKNRIISGEEISYETAHYVAERGF